MGVWGLGIKWDEEGEGGVMGGVSLRALEIGDKPKLNAYIS